ncbi:MAG: hypothetical protein IMZ52_09415, partial [Actinobacteria bacterium]|nr:hypothetical protein [Actinomycetota bacterium]
MEKVNLKNKIGLFKLLAVFLSLLISFIFLLSQVSCCWSPQMTDGTAATLSEETEESETTAETTTPTPTSTLKPIGNSVNLLANPGFERGSGNQPEGWVTTGWKPGKFLWDSTVAHSGRYSVKIDAPQANDLQWIQQVNVLPNSQYRFTAWVRTLDVGHSLEANDVGANLSVDGAYSWSENLKGTN